MKIRRPFRRLPLSIFLLRLAAVLVPRSARTEWLAEWKAELWHVRHAWSGEQFQAGSDEEAATTFCMGAFQDAFWLRWNNPRPILRPLRWPVFRLGSAARCGVLLAAWAAVSLSICFCFQGTRKALLPSPSRDAGDLVILSRGGYSGLQSPAIRLSDYRAWKTNTGRLFTEIAFYQPMLKRVHITRHGTARLSIARASSNLFELLNVPLSMKEPVPASRPYSARLILSRSAWHRFFGSDPGILGGVDEIAGEPVLIAGVIPDDSWRQPGQIDAWMLENDEGLDAQPSNSKGFVLGRVKAMGFAAVPGKSRTMNVLRSGGERESFNCISIAEQARLPLSIFLFTLLLAFVALPATTPLPLGDYPVRSDIGSRSTHARRWIFLAMKFGLILPIVYFCSLDLAYSFCPLDSAAAIYIQFASSFFGFLFAFRWALRDQRRRCPVCLRLLSNPAHVGEASRNFLAWNGTELICAGGHGLLHIPEIPTSWFSSQRWLYLDPSWRGLFSDAYVSPHGAM